MSSTNHPQNDAASKLEDADIPETPLATDPSDPAIPLSTTNKPSTPCTDNTNADVIISESKDTKSAQPNHVPHGNDKLINGGSSPKCGAAATPQISTCTIVPTESLQLNLDTASTSIAPATLPLPTPYKEVSISDSAFDLTVIILCNCICSGVTCGYLLGVSRRTNSDQSQTRVFNTLTLFFSAILAFGIGYLCDRVGLLGRGALLQSRAYPAKHIGYIIKGSLSSYLLLLIGNPRSLVVIIYVLCSLCGRFAVAFLGFGYNMEQTLENTPPLLRPDWINLTVSRGAFKIDNTTSSDDASETEISPRYYSESFYNDLWGSLNIMCEIAQVARGLALPEDSNINSDEVNPEEWGNVEAFADVPNIKMEIEKITLPLQLGYSGKVRYRYQFQDFRGLGGDQVFSGWEIVIESSCIRFEIPLLAMENSTSKFVPVQRLLESGEIFETHPFLLSNFDNDPGQIPTPNWRWILPTVQGSINETNYSSKPWEFSPVDALVNETWRLETVPRDEGFRLWLLGWYGPESWNAIYPTNFLFNCTVSIEDVITSPEIPTMPTDFLEGDTKRRILGQRLYDFLRISFVMENANSHDELVQEPLANITDIWVGEKYKDIIANQIFNWGVSQYPDETSEIWLAAYMGRYLVNQLSFLNDFLAPIEIEPGHTENRRQLIVKWSKILPILGGLACFQILLAIVALWYCRGKFELLDDVSTISSVLDGFSGTTGPKGTVCSGEFVREGNGFRWVLVKRKQD